MLMRFLPESIVLAIHDDQIRLYGGTYGVRDANALDAALHMPPSQFDGQYLHPSLCHMAAAYGFHLSQNHPFLDGNKRVAGMSMFTFLRFNGVEPIASELDYYHTMMAVASGALGKEQLTGWLQTVINGVPPDIM